MFENPWLVIGGVGVLPSILSLMLGREDHTGLRYGLGTLLLLVFIAVTIVGAFSHVWGQEATS